MNPIRRRPFADEAARADWSTAEVEATATAVAVESLMKLLLETLLSCMAIWFAFALSQLGNEAGMSRVYSQRE